MQFQCKATLLYFNPRAREGRDVGAFCRTYSITISIHAPARGATSYDFKVDNILIISIHAPARGATFTVLFKPDSDKISIHAPARGATMSRQSLSHPAHISIHAPARGATFITCFSRFFFYNFNPRAREGRDMVETVGV